MLSSKYSIVPNEDGVISGGSALSWRRRLRAWLIRKIAKTRFGERLGRFGYDLHAEVMRPALEDAFGQDFINLYRDDAGATSRQRCSPGRQSHSQSQAREDYRH